MTARALMKRGVAIAQEVHGSSNSKQERPIATPLRAQNVRTEQMMTELSGRAATEAAIEKAVLALEDSSWTVQSLLEKKGLKGLNFTMVPEREVWASVRAEVAAAAAEGRVAFRYIDFTAKPMLPAHVSQEEIGGRGSLPGQEVEGIASDDGLRTLQAAMRRVTGNRSG